MPQLPGKMHTQVPPTVRFEKQIAIKSKINTANSRSLQSAGGEGDKDKTEVAEKINDKTRAAIRQKLCIAK